MGTNFTKVVRLPINGFWDLNDLTTQTTPLSYISGNLTIPCDKNGPYSTEEYKPLDIDSIFNSQTSQFDFSGFSLGDQLIIRTDLLVTTTAINQEADLDLVCDIGGNQYSLHIGTWQFKAAGEYQLVGMSGFYIGNVGTRDNPAEIVFSSEDGASIKVNGFYITTNRRI